MAEERTHDQPVILVAASGLAREVAVAAHAAGLDVLGVLDDNAELWGKEVSPGLSVLAGIDAAADYPGHPLVVCAGKGTSRRSIVQRLSGLGVDVGRFATVIDPSARVPDPSAVGPGTVLLGGVMVTADVRVGAHVVCMPHAVLTHDCVVEDFATLCAGVVLGGGVVIGRAAYLGMASAVRENRVVGAGAVLGMGAVLLRDLPAGQTWAGVPAKPLEP